MRHLLLIVALLISVATLTACDGSLYYAENAHLDEQGWSSDEYANFHVQANDTTQLYDFLVEVRNTNDYPYANIFFFIQTTFPDGSTAQDTLECPLADASGQWYGRRSGRYISSRYYFRRNARFPYTGQYTFRMAQAMRDSLLTGLADVGLRIEYSKK